MFYEHLSSPCALELTEQQWKTTASTNSGKETLGGKHWFRLKQITLSGSTQLQRMTDKAGGCSQTAEIMHSASGKGHAWTMFIHSSRGLAHDLNRVWSLAHACVAPLADKPGWQWYTWSVSLDKTWKQQHAAHSGSPQMIKHLSS